MEEQRHSHRGDKMETKGNQSAAEKRIDRTDF